MRLVRGDRRAPGQEGELDEKRAADDLAAELLDELAQRPRGAAGGQQVVVHEHAAPGAMQSSCSSRTLSPYSSEYDVRIVVCGSVPGLRASTKPAPSSRASAGPKRKPRASAPMTTSGRRSRVASVSASIAAPSPTGLASSGVMSRNTIPGFGKSGIERM